MSMSLALPFQLSFAVSISLVRGGLKDLQRDVRRESRRALARAFKHGLAEIEKALLRVPIVCRGCAGPMRSRGRSTRRIVTIFGPVEIRRVRYRCRQCGAVRRPLDEWLGLSTDVTAMVREQALFLAADLPYDRAAEVLRRVGGIGMSGRQIQRLLESESGDIEAALGGGSKSRASDLDGRFRRAGKKGAITAGARRLVQLRRLRTSGLWDAYWSGRLKAESVALAAGETSARRKDARAR
jgi:hypothetical protein